MSDSVLSKDQGKFVRIAGLLVAVIGAVMVLAGIATWVFTSSQLSSQGITVSAVTEEDPGPFAGSAVDSPWTAMAQANAINAHSMKLTGDRTYAEIPSVTTPVDEQTDQEKADVKARGTAMNGSFLQAALFTSVIAFGIAFLVFGLGVTFVLVGLALRKVGKRTPVVEYEAAKETKAEIESAD